MKLPQWCERSNIDGTGAMAQRSISRHVYETAAMVRAVDGGLTSQVVNEYGGSWRRWSSRCRAATAAQRVRRHGILLFLLSWLWGHVVDWQLLVYVCIANAWLMRRRGTVC